MDKITKKILLLAWLSLLTATNCWAAGAWEKQGSFFFLTKDTRENFSAKAAGANKFAGKYLTYDGIDFLVRGANDWMDYGRLNLGNNNLCSLPIRPGMKVDEVHFLAGGNFGNSYEHDKLLHLFGDNYYYAVITAIFAYEDGTYKELSVPVFWDWFHVGPIEWSKEGAKIKSVGSNPVRKDCSISHISFINPKASQPLKSVLITDSWLSDLPFSEIFAVTLKSGDSLESIPKQDRKFEARVKSAANEPSDIRTGWTFDNGLDGWIAGCSENWDSDAFWLADSYNRKGVVDIPACNWTGDKFSWIEKKVTLPAWDKIELRFSRHSAVYSELDKHWSDGLLKVLVKTAASQEAAYEKITSGEWSIESADLSRYKGQTVILRFENHGGGQVRLNQTTSPACDGEDAIIDDIRLNRP